MTTQRMSYIIGALGKSFYTDKVTEDASKIGFVRVCIEFDLTTRFPDEFDLVLPNEDGGNHFWIPMEAEILYLV